MTRAQHLIPSGIVAFIALWVFWISYTQQPADAFLFPRLISSVFLVLAVWTFGKAVLGLSKSGTGLNMMQLRNLAPGVIVSAIYVFWAARTFGFYAASAVVFFVLLSLYDPARNDAIGSWVRHLGITVGYIAVMYGLFAVLLKVYTPRGMFF